MITISTEYVRDRITPRPIDMHKGQAGRVLVVAGSPGMAGAAVLALRGALYSGAGLVKALVPRELFNIIQISVPEAMCVDRDEFCKGSMEHKRSFLKEFDGAAIGPGMGVNEENLERTKKMIYGEYVKEYDDVVNIYRMFLSDYFKGINSFEYLEEINTINVEYLNQVLKDVFNEKNMILSVVKS